MISFGAVIGKTAPAQLLVMVFIECIVYSLNARLYYSVLGGMFYAYALYVPCSFLIYMLLFHFL